MPSIGPPELIIVMIIFGVGKLPQVGGAMGKAIREFRQAQSGEEGSEPTALDTQPKDRQSKE